MASQNTNNLLEQLQGLNAQQLRRLLVEHLTRQKLGLYWESNAIERCVKVFAPWCDSKQYPITVQA